MTLSTFISKVSLSFMLIVPVFNVQASNGGTQVPSPPSDKKESNLAGGEIYQKLGQKISLDTAFTNQNGTVETLKDMLENQKALIISLNYYRCTTMCAFQFANLASALKKLDWPIGDGFRVSTISFDSTDTVKLAKEKQAIWRGRTGQNDSGWNFYVGDHKNIQTLTQELNFYYEKNDDEFAHSAALFFIKPDGTFYRYLYGIIYESEDIKHALIETSGGLMGNFFQKMFTKLKKYQPATGKYL